jgi:DnaJ-class molecular chaperone
VTLLTAVAALQDIIRGSESAAPQPAPVAAPMVWCTACGGSGEGHSAYADTVCNACDGVGKRRADWRTLPDGDDLPGNLEDY